MKRSDIVFAITLILTVTSCKSSKNSQLEPGYRLNYNITSGQQSSNIEVTMKKAYGQWGFDYAVKDENLSGHIVATRTAVASSNELFHAFDGKDNTLTAATSLRISDSTFVKLNNGQSTDISYRIGFVKNTYSFQVVDKQKLKLQVNGKLKTLEVLYIKDIENKGHAMWVWNNAETPLIFRLKLGYELVIKDMYLP
jgi:hypothetical protein